MNKLWLKGKWNEYQGRAKQRWGKLTDDDLMRVEGKRDELVGAVQRTYGHTREQVERELDEWERELERAPRGTAQARERISDANPIDTGERGTTGPAGI